MLTSVGYALADWSCVGCDRPGTTWCEGCDRTLRAGAFRAVPSPRPVGLPDVWSAAAYDGVVRAAVVAFKERDRRGLRRPLGSALALAVVSAVASSVARDGRAGVRPVLVPVPSGSRASRGRETVPVVDLARAAAPIVGAGTTVRQWLVPSRVRADQAGLSHAHRAANLAGSVTAVAAVPRRSVVVLVDDIVTTGATLAECARALRDVGVAPLAAATVAATARRTGPPGALVA